MRTYISILIMLLAALAAVISCSDKGTKSEVTDPPKAVVDHFPQTPREDAEAEWAALWLSEALVAPESLYQQVHSDLARVRAAYGDSISQLRTIFFGPQPRYTGIDVSLTDSAYAAYLLGDYHSWDSLNQYFGLVQTQILDLRPYGIWFFLSFRNRVNGDSLAGYYAHLPGVRRAEADGFGGDFSNVYPWRVGDQRTYLWRYGYGDCPAGCIDGQFWYFRVNDSTVEYLGTFVRTRVDTPGTPPWWEEAKVAYCRFQGWPGNCP
jgi:hypothetical protein